MKLNEIKNVVNGTVDLNEGIIPIHISMTLGQIIRDEKITNNVQYFILASLIEMFKNGSPHRWPRDMNSYEMVTSSDELDAVKSLSSQEIVQIANWLFFQLKSPATFETNPYYCNPHATTVDWVKTVLQHQK